MSGMWALAPCCNIISLTNCDTLALYLWSRPVMLDDNTTPRMVLDLSICTMLLVMVGMLLRMIECQCWPQPLSYDMEATWHPIAFKYQELPTVNAQYNATKSMFPCGCCCGAPTTPAAATRIIRWQQNHTWSMGQHVVSCLAGALLYEYLSNGWRVAPVKFAFLSVYNASLVIPDWHCTYVTICMPSVSMPK